MIKNEIAAFVIPYLASNNYEQSIAFLDKTIEGIQNQTDDKYHIILVEDGSGVPQAIRHLNLLKEKLGDKITIHFNKENLGTGESRNIAIRIAYERQYPYILFNDADDISHPKRVEETRKIFNSDPDAAVLYSTFSVIDETGKQVPEQQLAPCINEILNTHKNGAIEGYDVWKKMGYFNLTSTTSVRTELAIKGPFPRETVSEDVVAWMRYSVLGGKFVYTPFIPSLYRIPTNTEGNSSRLREGGKKAYFSQIARVNAMGFQECIQICLKENRISQNEANHLLISFFINLAITLESENQEELARVQVEKAREISICDAELVIIKLGLDRLAWMQ